MRLLLFASPALLALWALSCLYTVDQAEFAYVTQFGRPVLTRDGALDAGLHLKFPWPVQTVQRVDRRLQAFDLPPVESLTRDAARRTIDKTLTVSAFVCWRIPDAAAVDRFVRTLGTPEAAQRVLGQRVAGRVGAVVSDMPLDDLISVADAGAIDERVARVRRRVLGGSGAESLAAAVLEAYGVELVDVRLRRFNYPEQVRGSIAERIKSERAKKVAEYESQGRREASRIVSEAERDAAKLISAARADAERVRATADAEADRVRNDAHARDPEFYAFLQKLKSYRAMLAESRDVLLLSTRNEMFDVLFGVKKRADAAGTKPPAGPTP